MGCNRLFAEVGERGRGTAWNFPLTFHLSLISCKSYFCKMSILLTQHYPIPKRPAKPGVRGKSVVIIKNRAKSPKAALASSGSVISFKLGRS